MIKFHIVVGRICGLLAFLALLGAWSTQGTGGTFLGMSQQHLFNDAIVFALFAIAGLLDALVHAKRIWNLGTEAK